MREDAALLAAAQAAYFGATGLWPLLHMRSFLAVTGPKRDLWLVRTVGALVLAIAGSLAVAAARGVDAATATLAAGSALALAAIDVVHVARGTISRIYLADAAVEVAIIVAWAWMASG